MDAGRIFASAFFISGFCIPFSSLFALTERDIMKITYHFSDGIKEIEVPQEWADFIFEMDRLEYNIEHRETRRHCSLEAYNLDDNLIPSGSNPEDEVFKELEYEALDAAIKKLLPRQQKLIYQVFFEGRTYTSIAREEGVDESAIRHAVGRAIKKLKKLLS